MFTEKAFVRKSGLFLPYISIHTERDGFVHGFEWKEEERGSALRRDRWVRVAGSDATSSSRCSRHGRPACGEAVGQMSKSHE